MKTNRLIVDFGLKPIVNGDVTWEPWTNGHAVGFRATNKKTGAVQYVYLNPSGSGDSSPDVFVYMDEFGDPAENPSPEIYLVPFDDAVAWDGVHAQT